MMLTNSMIFLSNGQYFPLLSSWGSKANKFGGTCEGEGRDLKQAVKMTLSRSHLSLNEVFVMRYSEPISLMWKSMVSKDVGCMALPGRI